MIDKLLLRWFGHVERMGNDRNAKRVYAGECNRSSPLGKPWKRGINTVKHCLKKKGLKDWISGKQGEWCMIEAYGGGL